MRRALLSLPLIFAIVVAGLQASAQETKPDQRDEKIPAPASPRHLLEDVPARLGGEFVAQKINARESADSERRAAAALWLADVFSPLEPSACAAVLTAFGRDPHPPDKTLLAPLFPAGRPIATRGGEVLLVPSELPAQEASDAEFLNATGVLPFEVSLTGEWARYVGAVHAGPPARDPLLRLSRAARLEGVARLAGIFVSLQGSGVAPASLGSALLAVDTGRSGWPQTPLRDSVSDPVARALLTTYFEDGLRWATVQYLSGRWTGLMSSLEKPGVGPEALFGARPSAGSVPVGPGACRLGPRGALALLDAAAQPEWLTQIISDQASTATGVTVLQLHFDSAAAAARAAAEIEGWGYQTRTEETIVTVRPRKPASPASGS
ncbi:MAG: hypothetical protein U0V87_00530 [Acidobacteriota bacterium]